MAPFSNFISFLFLTSLLLPLQINARGSQFFSKFNNNNVKETELPHKERPLNKPEQQPAFIPETDNSYGLYGHESSQFPTATTTTNSDPYTTTTNSYDPYKTGFEDTSKYPNNKKYYNYNNHVSNTNQHEFSNNNNNNYYNKDAYAYAYGGNQNELSDTKYTEAGDNSLGNQNNDNHKYYNYNNNNAANNRYNGEKQGMSDTRYFDGGKYFYDVKKHNPTLYDDSSREVNSHNWYNNRNNFGKNNANYYQNNNYQNQEEFEEDQEEFEP